MSRSRGLDVLRAVAVSLVLWRHLPVPAAADPFTRGVVTVLIRGGWTGVDLFFVISGFLVSGLLFREYRKTGGIDAARFLVRRGFRIYPPFWLFIAVTIGYLLVVDGGVRIKRVGVELLFLQSYFYTGTLWMHGWSLSVEEHFYLLLVPFFLLLGRSKRGNPFSAVPWIYAAIALCCLLARVLTRMYGPDDARATLFPTHLRIDSLFCGVLLAYAYHFFPDAFQSWTRKHARLLTVAGVCAFVPAFVFPMEHSDWVLTIGLTGLALGSACFVSTAVAGVARPNRFLDAVAYVGSHSYSIYLWQGPVDAWLLPRFGPAVMSHWGAHAFVFISLALLVGIGFARLTETPALRLRDRLFPSKGLPLAA